jgi:hypothetical protein
VDLTPEEVRVLGALIEKQRTTPDQYPLSLNAIRLACNQSTNRDPIVEFDEATIREALERLSRRRWTRLASGAGSRATKYRHLLDEALGLDVAEISVLTVLMLRGPQTPGELRARTERLHRFDGGDELRETIERLAARGAGRGHRAPAGPEGGALRAPPGRGWTGGGPGRRARRGGRVARGARGAFGVRGRAAEKRRPGGRFSSQAARLSCREQNK